MVSRRSHQQPVTQCHLMRWWWMKFFLMRSSSCTWWKYVYLVQQVLQFAASYLHIKPHMGSAYIGASAEMLIVLSMKEHFRTSLERKTICTCVHIASLESLIKYWMLKKKKINTRFSLKADASKVAEYIVEHHKYEVQYITESEAYKISWEKYLQWIHCLSSVLVTSLY